MLPQNMMEKLKHIDPAVLTEVVRQDQKSPTFEILDWTVERLSDKGIINPDGLFRFKGQGRDETGTRDWSVALKIIKDAGTEEDTRNMWYWKRELLAVQSGLLASLPGPVTAPRFYTVAEQEGSGWLWQELIIADSTNENWTTDQFAFAAREIGRFNGAYLVGVPLPDFPWLCQGHARTWSSLPPDGTWANPFVSRVFSNHMRERVLRLWNERERFYIGLERLPQIFSHFDFHPRNLFIRSREDNQQELVAVDWAMCGYGPLGGDLYPLIGASALVFELESSAMPEVEIAVFEAYLSGLNDAGWHGDPALARLGYTAWLALWLGVTMPGLIAVWTSDNLLPRVPEVFGRSPEQFASDLVPICEFALDRADEARLLMDRLMM